MRLWSISFEYLDAKGLVALWREGLLARNVLMNKTKGYKNHPQLTRFKNLEDPVSGVNQYLHSVVDEADRRGYNFKREKLDTIENTQTIKVTIGQVMYERKHLLSKLLIRDKDRYNRLISLEKTEVVPMFTIIDGDIEDWEIIK